jgi:polysaccharide biosynthesis transport protein
MMPEGSNRNLPVLADAGHAPEPYRANAFAHDFEPENASLPPGHYWWVVKRHRWKILSFVAASAAAAFMISSRIRPVYESTATVDIDRQVPTGVIGQESNRSALNDSDQFLSTQIKLIQSDSVLRPVAAKFGLREMESGSEQTRGAMPGSQAEAPVKLRHLKVDRPRNT